MGTFKAKVQSQVGAGSEGGEAVGPSCLLSGIADAGRGEVGMGYHGVSNQQEGSLEVM